MLTQLGGIRNITMPIFFQNWSIQSRDIAIFQFLLRDAMLSAVYAVVVCLCVCVCVCHTPVLYQNG